MAILHITFSLSTRGSLKQAIRQKQLQRDESVICVHDIFSIGPLTNLEERKKWLNSYILKDEDERELYEDMQNDWKKKIQGIPCDVDVWIWYGQNAHEEIGLRFVMSEFANKCSMVFGIDTTEGLKRTQPNMEIRHTGELPADSLMKLRADAKRFSVEEGNKLAKEWHALQQNPSTLRIWQNGIEHVEENTFDEVILARAKHVQESEGSEWLLPMRVIGEAVGHLSEYVEDAFIEKRIFALAKKGFFEIDGDPTDIYTYKLKYTGQ
ncbi:hypothetical protein AEA09_10030 [Lysinibacillus contaminans]|uniref:DUF1835 domain-containing protein n=1 Tax=Lysinibacillus contaminans TaxID=1293441 RepID=A0ABR5K255_9BACI|nr:DUF1835 domain-containing protein [Lysinibacillus contaminans]KOS68843.1 hypothetical protein AEA09_10030 [Lysinibacillus contaminans]